MLRWITIIAWCSHDGNYFNKLILKCYIACLMYTEKIRIEFHGRYTLFLWQWAVHWCMSYLFQNVLMIEKVPCDVWNLLVRKRDCFECGIPLGHLSSFVANNCRIQQHCITSKATGQMSTNCITNCEESSAESLNYLKRSKKFLYKT